MKKLKRFLASLMVVIMVLTAAPLSGFVGLELPNIFDIFASAASYSGTCGANLTWSLDTSTGELIVTGTGDMYDYYYISRLPWYSYSSSIKKVTIENGVTSISDSAFSGCSSLTSVTISDSVTNIRESAFSGCSSLTSIKIGNGVKTIARDAFYNTGYYNNSSNWEDDVLYIGNYLINVKSSLSGAYTIKGGTKCIADYAFSNRTKLTSITIPDSVTSIGISAFYGCASLTSIIIPDSVTSIGNSAFRNCTRLTSITIPNGVKSIYTETFSYCTSLTSITIPDSVTSIGDAAFYYCTSLTNITIPDSVTSIGDRAFADCTNLKNITLGNGVTSIGEGALVRCTSLTSITIPDSVTNIGDSAFNGCSSMTRVIVAEGNTVYSSDECGVLFNKDKTELIKYPTGNKQTSYTISDSVTSIGISAFWNCTSLTNITIPDSVTSIGEDAFYNTGYYNDSSNWEDDVLYIGNHLIKAKTSLSGSCTIKESTRCIADYAFFNCTSLESITISDSVISIGYYAFYACTNLTSITIPKSVTSIGDYAFYDCTSFTDVYYTGTQEQWNSIAIGSSNDPLTSATIHFIQTGKSGDNLTWSLDTSTGELVISGEGEMDDYSSEYINGFYRTTVPWSSYISSIKKVTIEDGVTSIGSCAFRGCTSLTSITIPDSVTSIGKYAFLDCRNLTSITIPDSVTSIGDSAFYRCDSLTSITIPDSVTSIGSSAFAWCENLTSITIPDSVTSIGSSAFSYCTGLTSVTILGKTTTFGDSVFSDKVILYLVKDSPAETYAKNNDIIYYYLDDGTDENLISVAVTPKLSFEISKETYTMTVNCDGTMISFADEEAPWYPYRGYIKHIVINDGCNNISDSAFKNMGGLESIVIPDSVSSIGSSAFYNCSGIKELTMPISAKIYNSSYTFYKCTNIEKITLTKGNGTAQNYGTSTSSSATSTYYGYTPWYISRSSLKELTIEDGVTGIGSYAFYYCSGLTSIIIGNGVTSIGSYAFNGCTSLTSITIPDSVTSIGSSAFYNCTSLTSITVVDDNTAYSSDEYGVLFNKDKTSLVQYPSGNKRTSYTIPDSVTSIGDSAFYKCTSLTSITIPDSVTSIGNYAFDSCSSLTSITIPDSVTSIGSYTFNGCWRLTSITIPDSVTSIGSSAFYNCTSLTSVTIPDSVTSIGWYSFRNCTSLTSITIPDGVTSIGDQAFYSCESLISITIPDSVTSIGYDAFDNTGYYNDSSNWEDDVLYIGNHLIEAKRDITGSYKVKAGTKTIGSKAFYLCDSIISVTIPESVTTIGYDSLYRGGLRTIYYEGDIADWCSVIIENPYAIYNGNTDLYINGKLVAGDIVIPDGVTSIGQYAFAYRENITSITIPDSVTDIGNEAFRACYELSSVTVPSSLEKVGNILFYNCRQPITVYFDGTEYEWSRGEYSEWFSEASEIIYMIQHGDEKDVHSVISETPVTCTTAGKKTYLCRCGETYTEDIPALGHNPEYFKVDPTCKEAGYECYKCTNCGTEYMREELDIIDHISGDWEIVETATCSEDGYKIRKCTMCGEETHRETIPATGHSYEESIVTEPTCEGVGVKRFTCSVCGDSYDEEIAANGHKIKVIRKEPTCTSMGNEQSLCEVCGNMIGEMTFIPKLPHDYAEEVVAEPTCVKEGTKRYTCSSCGDSYNETLPATGEHKIQTIRKEPTCTSIGNEQYLCETCGNMIGDMVFLPKLPHAYGEWTVVKDPTATEDGSKVHSCTACGKTETVVIPAIGFETADGVTVDLEKNIISGFNAGVSSLDSYTTIVNENYVWEYEAANGKLGTGSKAILKYGETVVAEYTILVYGDTTGDSWYDGQDAIIVSCLANGMLTKDDVSEAVYTAADCNHDGVIDQLDVDLLNEAGTLLANVDQTKPTEVLLETSSEYVEYLDLIDQSPEIEIEDEPESPEADVETEDKIPGQDTKVDVFGMIMNFIRYVIEMILSRIPVPYR